MPKLMEAEEVIFSKDRRTDSVVLSVVMPMYNEGHVISRNIRRAIQGLKALKVSWEIILVNDGSTDKTAEIARSETAQFPQLEVISYALNRGRGYALRKGFKAARGKFIISTESDLSWGVETLLKIFHRLQESDEDIVVASPYCTGGKLENVPLNRALLSRLGNRILGLTFSGRVTMVSGMTRGYRREVLEAMRLESEGKEIHLEILSKASALGFRIGEIPAVLRWERGRSGRLKGSQRHTGKLIVSHLLFSFGEFPFLLFGSIGMLLLSLGVSLGGYAYFLSWSGTRMGGRPLILVSILFILFGFQISVFCFLANQNRDLRNAIIRLHRSIIGLGRGKTESDILPQQPPGQEEESGRFHDHSP